LRGRERAIMSWLQRLKQGLQRSSTQLTQGITQIF
jgi:hypothetical protein